jgi:hypothetical protein
MNYLERRLQKIPVIDLDHEEKKSSSTNTLTVNGMTVERPRRMDTSKCSCSGSGSIL